MYICGIDFAPGEVSAAHICACSSCCQTDRTIFYFFSHTSVRCMYGFLPQEFALSSASAPMTNASGDAALAALGSDRWLRPQPCQCLPP